jgi:3-methyladenine DNA glycosylase AlkC
MPRKGASRISAVPAALLQALQAGQTATVNLVEFLAIDLTQLAPQVAQSIGLDPQAWRLQNTLASLGAYKPMQRHGQIARALFDMAAPLPERDCLADRLANHPSDIARSWAAYWLTCSDLGLAEKLRAVRRFAVDSHFGVREMAWSALRADVIAQLDQALVLLAPWVRDSDAGARRFACEVTRPRGVWCAQIEALKAAPWRAEALLTPLLADPSRYVQNSVANWLNDASKSEPQWVQQLCQRWLAQSAEPATRYITQRALRTLSNKAAS